MSSQESQSAYDDRVTRQQFLEGVAQRLGAPVDWVRAVYDSMLDEIMHHVAQDKRIMLSGFGQLYKQVRKGHTVRFADTPDGTPASIDAYTVLKFSATAETNRQLGELSQELESATEA